MAGGCRESQFKRSSPASGLICWTNHPLLSKKSSTARSPFLPLKLRITSQGSHDCCFSLRIARGISPGAKSSSQSPHQSTSESSCHDPVRPHDECQQEIRTFSLCGIPHTLSVVVPGSSDTDPVRSRFVDYGGPTQKPRHNASAPTRWYTGIVGIPQDECQGTQAYNGLARHNRVYSTTTAARCHCALLRVCSPASFSGRRRRPRRPDSWTSPPSPA